MRKQRPTLRKVKSLFNGDMYYTSENFPSKYIDGKEFIGVKKTETDRQIHYMMKENLEYLP
jgi:hypothetical protein